MFILHLISYFYPIIFQQNNPGNVHSPVYFNVFIHVIHGFFKSHGYAYYLCVEVNEKLVMRMMLTMTICIMTEPLLGWGP